MPHPLACDEDSKQTLPAEADDRIGRRHVGPFARQLVGDRSEEPCAGVVPRRRQRLDEQWVGWRTRDLDPTLGCLDVLEHRAIYWTSVGLRDRRSLPHTESERVFLRTP